MKERKQKNYVQEDEDNRTMKRRQEEDLRKPNRAKKGKPKKKRPINKEFARVTYVFVALFLFMMGYIVYFNLFRSQEMVSSPYNNKRQNIYADRVIRGKIIDQGENTIAETIVNEDGSETRSYPYGDMYGHVAGYASNGKAGLEATENFKLMNSSAFFVEKMIKEFKGEKNMGDTVVTTLNNTLQSAAYDALGGSKGAVVVMEPSTGKILAMLSKPCYDPNSVAENWEALNADGDGILVNRATQGAYAPGSTFKLVTALDFIRENPSYGAYTYECNGEITQDNVTIHCFDGTAHGTVTLADSIAYSCNSSFANIGLSLDKTKYKNTAEDLLFNKSLPSELPYRKSSFKLNTKSTSAETMMTAMGQGQTEVSPYHMALITSSIANGGILMKPYLVDKITNYNGTTVKNYRPEKYKELMTAQEASQLKEYMRGVVEYGTATIFAGENYTMAGKTGTAEYSSDKEKAHSWFVGFSNVDNPELVISVVVEGADDSGVKATNVAKAVIDAYYYG